MSKHIANLVTMFAAALVSCIGYAMAGGVGFAVGFTAFAALYLASAAVMRK